MADHPRGAPTPTRAELSTTTGVSPKDQDAAQRGHEETRWAYVSTHFTMTNGRGNQCLTMSPLELQCVPKESRGRLIFVFTYTSGAVCFMD